VYVVANGVHQANHPDGDDDMKVSELIELLEEQDPDAEVLMMMQENWPFECALAGVTTRAEMLRADREDRDEDDEEPRLAALARSGGGPRSLGSCSDDTLSVAGAAFVCQYPAASNQGCSERLAAGRRMVGPPSQPVEPAGIGIWLRRTPGRAPARFRHHHPRHGSRCFA